jgi:glycosyltransferase involved in cell wall biosynthesis
MKDKMNIVFMGNFPYPHGMAETRHVQYFVDYTTSMGIPAKLLVLRQGGENVQQSHLKGYHNNVYYLTIGSDLELGISLFYKLPLYLFRGFLSILKWRKRGYTNYIYCYNGPDIENILFIIFAKMIGYYIIFHIVEDFSYNEETLHLAAKIKNKSKILFDKYIDKFAHGIIILSRYLDNKYKKYKSNLIVEFIPISAECRENQSKSGFGKPIKFVYSGSFARKDGITDVIEAFSTVHAKYDDCLLVLTGKGGNLSDVKEAIKSAPGIIYAGYLEEEKFREFLEQADILLMIRTTSAFANAGFPFKIGEYLATGNPVIASDVSDVSFYLKDRWDVLLVEPGSVASIANAMEYCMLNQEEVQRIGQRGKSACKKWFSPSRNRELFLNLLEKIRDHKK